MMKGRDGWMTVTEIHRLLGVSRTTVRDYIVARRLLPAVRVEAIRGSRYYVGTEDFLTFAREQMRMNERDLARLETQVAALAGQQRRGVPPPGGRMEAAGPPSAWVAAQLASREDA
jgi:hypothetical protein